jgi:hypothetical protein
MLARAAVLALLAVPLAYAFTPSLTNLPALHHSSATSIGRGGNGLMHVPATRMARVAAMGLRMAEKGPLHDAIDKVARSSAQLGAVGAGQGAFVQRPGLLMF